MSASPPSLWGTRSLEPNETFEIRCGALVVDVTTGKDEVSLSSRFEGDGSSSSGKAETWTRWAIPPGTDSLVVTPTMPRYPVLVAPDTPFHVLPGAVVKVFLEIPISVLLRIGRQSRILEEFPTAILSQTWFGETDSGELCFWLATGLHRESRGSRSADIVEAPVTIRNESSESLQVSRLCLRVAHLSIYETPGGLWASETIVRYQGGPNPSKIDIAEDAPSEARGGTLVGEPREKGPRGRVGRTFRSLRQWTRDLLDVD